MQRTLHCENFNDLMYVLWPEDKNLKAMREIYFVYFDEKDVCRHALIKKILLAYSGEKSKN